MADAPAIFMDGSESAPAPAPEAAPAGHDAGSDHASAELVAAHHFVNNADTRDPQTAQIAAEINAMLNAGHPVDDDGGDGSFGIDAEQPRDSTGKFVPRVPHQALHQERLRRKEAETKAHAVELQLAKAQERLDLLNELAYGPPDRQQQQPQQRHDDSSDVDPETDIFEAVRRLQKQNSKQRESATYAQLNRAYQSDAVKFQKQNPDLMDAYAHLAASRDRELAIMGMADAEQRKRQVLHEEQTLVVSALQAGQSPAQMLYELAQAKGFRSRGNGAGDQQAFAPDPRAVEQIQQVQRGKAAAASLSGAGGSPGAGLSIAQIAAMPDDQFERLIDKMGGLGDPRVKRAFGG